MRRHVFCEITQRFGDKHSRTCQRLIQFNINCLKHSFYSTGPLLLLSFAFSGRALLVKGEMERPAYFYQVQ